MLAYILDLQFVSGVAAGVAGTIAVILLADKFNWFGW